jgi:HD-like signal output (HDOD) protein
LVDVHPALDALVDKIGELNPLPDVAVHILGIAGEDRSSAPELAQAISRDQALTARVLRLANSAYYGFPRRITTVRDAVVLLGFRTIRATALASSVMAAMRGDSEIDRANFWCFSIAVGQLAEILARGRREHLDEAFTAGVLHNIGRLALAQQLPGALGAVRRMAAAEMITVAQAEQAVLGYTDAELGGRLAMHWNFPQELSEAIARHQLDANALPDPRSLAAFVSRARLFARSAGMVDGVDRPLVALPDAEWASPPLAELLTNAGGIGGVRDRASAFVDTASAA